MIVFGSSWLSMIVHDGPRSCHFKNLDLVQLEEDIGYIESSHTDLSSSN